MTQEADQPEEFECGACGRRFPWKLEWAGRTLKCKCGEEIVCPAEPEEELYSVVPIARPTAGAGQTTIVPMSSTSNHGNFAGPTHTKTRASEEQSGRLSPTSDPHSSPIASPGKPSMDVYVPLLLIGGGVAVEIVAAIFGAMPLRIALRDVVLRLTIVPAIMMMGILIAARFRGIEFGDFLTAALKLAAISIGAGAAGTALELFAHMIPFLGGLAVLLVQFILYFALIGAMFNLDESDTWYCVSIFFILSVAMYFVALYAASFK